MKKLHIFLSHSSADAKLAGEVCRILEKDGHSCFIAPRDIRSGHEYAEELIDGIDNSDVMLLLLSKQANSSPHVLREVERAVSKNKPIIVYKLGNFELSKSMEYFLMTHQWLDSHADKNYNAILKCINEFAGDTKEEAKPSRVKPIIPIAVIIFAIVLAAVIVMRVRTAGSPSNAATLPDYGTQRPVYSESAEVHLGDTLTFGTYNGEPVDWRVIHISDDLASAVVISDKILTMKSFDAAEGGEYNYYDGVNYWRTRTSELSEELQRLIRGDNRWELSNIRTWLNSAKEMVKYSDFPPTVKAMSMHNNSYDTESGFLHGFTDEELSFILTVQHTTGGSITEDKVYLLSEDELKWLYDADVTVHAEPTLAAVAHDESGWYSSNLDAYKTKDHFWWLRDADTSDSCSVRLVNISYGSDSIISDFAGLEGYGIRPAMTIDLTAGAFLSIMENNKIR